MKIKWGCLVLTTVLGLAACGGSDEGSGGGGGGGGEGGLNNAQSITGTCRSASGDPVSGVTVYIPGVAVSAQKIKATRSYTKEITASDGVSCEDPPSADQSLAAGCSSANGEFAIDTSAIATNPTQIVFVKGSLRMVQTLSCTADPCALGSTVTTFGGGTTTWPDVAVVTGSFDSMESVLAKLADSNTGDDTNGQYGRVSSIGIFVYGSEYGTHLTIIDGNSYLTPSENTDSVTYQTWDKYLDGTYPLVENGSPVFDVVFIDCGTSYDSQMTETAKRAVLQAYVNAGGRLYVTDWSYDYVEQAFPQVMRFEGDPADSSTPGGIGDAQAGTAGVYLDAAVNDSGMSSWLGAVTVNRHDATTPGNPDIDDTACYGASAYDQITGALTSAGKIPIGDFLGSWAQMIGAHTGQSPTIWISSGEGVSFDGLDNRPLTVSMAIGSNGGKVIYSSYHTAGNCPTLTFWPQERVLQYLIFESF